MTVLGKFVLECLKPRAKEWTFVAELPVSVDGSLDWVIHGGNSPQTLLDIMLLSRRTNKMCTGQLMEALRDETAERLESLHDVMQDIILKANLRPRLIEALGKSPPHTGPEVPEWRLSFEWADPANKLEPGRPPSCKVKPVVTYENADT